MSIVIWFIYAAVALAYSDIHGTARIPYVTA